MLLSSWFEVDDYCHHGHVLYLHLVAANTSAASATAALFNNIGDYSDLIIRVAQMRVHTIILEYDTAYQDECGLTFRHFTRDYFFLIPNVDNVSQPLKCLSISRLRY